MSLFDQEVNRILKEAQFGKGGMSNQSGTIAPQAGNQAMNAQQPAGIATNAQAQFAGNPKFSPSPNSNQPQNNNINPAQQGNINGNNVSAPDDTKEFNDLLALKDTNPTVFNRQAQQLSQNPERFQKFVNFITQPTVR